MRKLGMIMLAGVMAAGVVMAGCNSAAPSSETAASGGASASGEKKTIYFVSLKVGGAAWSQAQQGFEDACKELGWDGYYVAPTTANDSSQMANLCETAMTSQADAILGPLFDKDVFTDIINRAHVLQE